MWAFGCVLFEMLTGTRAFAGETVTDFSQRVVKEEPRWGDLPADTPAPMHRLLRRCLTKDRKQRLASAADARFDIEEALDTARIRRSRCEHPGTIASELAFVLGAVLVAAVGAYLLGSRVSPDARRRLR